MSSTSSSLLFSGLQTMFSDSSSSAPYQSRPNARRVSSFSNASAYSRDSWCSAAESEISVSSTKGHTSHDQDAFDHMVKTNFPGNAIFGSTSPRKNKSAAVRSSNESTRSWASSSSSVRSPLTPVTPLFVHPEHDVTRTPTLPTIALPSQPKLKRPHLARLVSDEVQYIGRSLDVPVSEDGHQDKVAVPRPPSSIASSRRPSAASTRFSTWSGKDGLKLAMDELEQELVRTMETLSNNNTPNSSISKARGKSMRRPHTADRVMTLSTARSMPMSLDEIAGSMSASPSSQARFQRESWMSSTSDGDGISFSGNPIRFSASDLDLNESAEPLKQMDLEAQRVERPVSQVSVASSTSSRGEFGSPSVPALVFDGRFSGSSTSSSGAGSSRPSSFVTADNGHVSLSPRTLVKRPTTGRSPSKGLYQLAKGARSTPSLASSAPPRDPLPPLPSMPAGLNLILAPPRPSKSAARTPVSSSRNSPVPFTHKPLPPLPC